MNNHLLSIVIPAFNAENYIIETLLSMINQNFEPNDVEFLVVNDGSFDNTEDIVRNFIISHEKFNIKIMSKENGGLSSARNYGINNALGKYLWFFDSDDIMESNCLGKILATIKSDDIDYISLGVRNHFKNYYVESNIRNKPSKYIVDGLEYIKKYEVEHSACVFVVKKEILLKNKIFFLDGVLSEDYDFVLRLCEFCSKITHLNMVCYNYIIRDGSLSRRKDNNYYIFHHKSMLTIIAYITEYFKVSKNVIYSKEVAKYIVQIKLIALANLLKSTLSLDMKKKYFYEFTRIGMLDLKYTGKVKWTTKQKLLIFLIKVKLFYPTLLLSKFKNEL